MSLLDVFLLAAAVVFAISGYRQGFLVGVLSLTGFLVGGGLGLWVAPKLISGNSRGVTQAVVAVGLVIGLAALGQILMTIFATKARAAITWRGARIADAIGGAFVSVIGLLIGAWLIASLVVQLGANGLTTQIRDSSVLTAIDGVMPRGADGLFSSFGKLLDDTGFPRVFGPLVPEDIVPVKAPDSTLVDDPAVQAARDSLVKIRGVAKSCREQLEGSGFVYAPERVMTNAHVVAGVDEPRIYVSGIGLPLQARVIVFDPDRDIAVLAVPGLHSKPLPFAGPVGRGADAVVAGFPGDGPLAASPARVRGTLRASGEDIYGNAGVTRQVYSLRAVVRPGNSGGPLLSPGGSVLGVVFAASLDDPETGYALTPETVASAAGKGASSGVPVSTGPCTR